MRKLLLALCLISLLGVCYIQAQEKASPDQEKQIKELIAQLKGDDSAKWEAAQKELLEIGVPARSYLDQALKEASNSEVKKRLGKIIDRLPSVAARDMLIKALEKISQTKGYRFSVTISASIAPKIPGAEPIRMPPTSAEGFTKGNNFVYIKTIMKDKVEEITEAYQKNNVIVYRKNTVENPDQWAKAAEDDSIYMDNLMSQPAGINVLRTLFDLARFGNNEKCQGVECRVIELPMTGEKLMALMPKGALKDMEGIQNAAMKYKAWVGKADQVIYKASVSAEVEYEITDPETQEKTGMSLDSYTDIKITDYNKEIKAEMPEAVKKLLAE